MEVRIPPGVEEKLKELEKGARRRIEKKLDSISVKVSELGVAPEKVVEKRLRGPLHPLLQQRVGEWRLWFEEDREKEILWLRAVKHKKEAADRY